MTSRDRFRGFLSHSTIDRVPVQLQNMMLAAGASGRALPDALCDPDPVVRGHLAEWENYRHDGVIVDIGTHAAAQALGCKIEHQPGELPRVVSGALSDWGQVRTLTLPDIRATYPLTVVLAAVQRLRRELGRHAVLIATVDQGPFTLASQVAGLETLLLALATGGADEEIRALIDFCTGFTLAYGRELARAGADVVRMGDSTSGPDIISPSMYRRWALPAQRELARMFAAEGIVFAFHVCGNATAIVADMVSTGAAYVEIDEKTDLRAAREAVRARSGINGPVSPRTLRFGTPADVERECRTVLQAWMPRPGLFFGPGCTIAPGTPAENIRVLIDCAHRYGSYAGAGERG